MKPDVRMRGFRDRAEVSAFQQLIEERVSTLPGEVIPLSLAAGRVLAASVQATVDVPGFDRAAMDGYALRGDETFGAGSYNPLEFAIVGESFPGRAFPGRLEAGQAIRIMTGAPFPEGADAVVPAENAEWLPGPPARVRVVEPIPPSRHVGRRGEDIQAGSTILPAGRRLRPQDLGILAAVGTGQVHVVRRPRVGILVTGNELLPCGSTPVGHQIVDSNSVMLISLLQRDSADAVFPPSTGGPAPLLPQSAPILPDNAEALESALRALLANGVDAVLLSGGSSVGEEDHAPQIVARLGELSLHGVALRPASPAGMGFIQGRPVFLMPGNPVSCLCAYDLFAGRAVRRLGGLAGAMPYTSAVLPLARKLSSVSGRVDYVRVQVSEGLVEPLATSGASILSSTTRASGFVLVPGDSEGWPAGTPIRVYFYDPPAEPSFPAPGVLS